MVHAARSFSTPASGSFPLSSKGWMVLEALEKSKNTTLTVLPGFSWCERDWCSRCVTASSYPMLPDRQIEGGPVGSSPGAKGASEEEDPEENHFIVRESWFEVKLEYNGKLPCLGRGMCSASTFRSKMWHSQTIWFYLQLSLYSRLPAAGLCLLMTPWAAMDRLWRTSCACFQRL